MKTIRAIRKRVFGLTQVEFGRLAGVSQTSVSRWERGELSPTLVEMSLIQKAAKVHGLLFDGRWFFEFPGLETDQSDAVTAVQGLLEAVT